MSFILLIVEPVGQRATRNEAQGREAYAAMQRFGEAIAAEGKLQAVASLPSTASAVRVSRAAGQPALRDGPFAEAKEMIGGFFLLQNVDRAEAIAWAKACPAAEWATVEVRALAPCFEDGLT